MDDSGILGSALGQAVGIAKKAGQQIAKVPEEVAKDVKEQIVGEKKEEKKQQASRKWASDEERKKFLKDLYGSAKQNSGDSSDNNPNNSPQSSSSDKKPTEFQKKIADKSPEEQKQLLELRQDLHKEVYYDPTFNPPKKQEERPAEKVEKEKREELQELQQKEEKKPQPLAVVREQNKAEMFRGVSG